MVVCEFVGVVKHRSLKCIAKAFRVVEFCFVLLLLLWISTRLPFAVRISGEYFRQLVGVILSPFFSFILCNFIVLTLLLKFRRYSGDSSVFVNVAGAELYDSFSADFTAGNSALETVYEDKQTIFEESIVITQESETEKCRKISNSGDISPETLMKSKVPRRNQSEKMNEENTEEEISVKLQISETEKCRKVTNSGDISPETAYEVEELSNEEFQKAIENFIAKQIKFHQQEKLAIVLHSQVLTCNW